MNRERNLVLPTLTDYPFVHFDTYGNQSAGEGNNMTSMSKKSHRNQYGPTPMMTAVKSLCLGAVPFKVQRLIPTGGVRHPISELIATSTPNRIGSEPR